MKIFFFFFIENIFAFIITYFLIFNGKYADGNVGMAPFLVIVALIIQIIISSIIYFTTKVVIKQHFIYFIINIIVYALVLFFIDMDGFSHIFKNDLSGFLTRNYLYAYSISTIFVGIMYFVIQNNRFSF